MNSEDITTLQAIERSGVSHTLYWCHWKKMRCIEHPHAIVTESDLPCPFFNNVYSASIPHPKAEAIVDDVTSHFFPRNVPCFWWSGPVNHDPRIVEVLESRRFAKAFEAPAMALGLSDCPPTNPGSAEVVEIDSEGQMAAWTRTCTAAFEFDGNLSGWWHELFTSIPHGGSSPLRHYLAYRDGNPVGTASAFAEDGVVGLASVGVRKEYRGQGVGSALTLAVLRNARERGCRLGVLFSSAMAESMYKRLGFRQYGTGHCYLWSPECSKEQA